MSEFTNGLTPAEAERLHLLMEECGEVIQAAAKVLRHGYAGRNPLPGASYKMNRESLETEIGQVMYSIRLMMVCQDVGAVAIRHWERTKAGTTWRWLHHQDKEVLDAIFKKIDEAEG